MTDTMKPVTTEADKSKARAWSCKHPKHVYGLMASTSDSFGPSGSDCSHPELWKAANWRWLYSVETPA